MQKCIHQAKIIFIIQYVQVINYILIGDVIATETYQLVEYGECVAHSAITFLSYNIQSTFFYRHMLLTGNIFQVVDRVGDGNAVEIIYLTARKYGWYDFMLFSGCQNEYGMSRRFFQSF